MEYGECKEQGKCYYNSGKSLRRSRECNHVSISGECSRRLRRILLKILRNVQEDCEDCLRKLRGMFEKIPRNVQEDPGEC